MKIAAIKTTPLLLPFRQPYHWSGRVDRGAAVVLVEVETDAGIIGVGESTAPLAAEGTLSTLAAAAPLFVGEPVHDVDRLITRARFLGGFNWTPRQANLVLAGLEMALWDAIGKAAGQPVYRLLGGRVRDSVDYFGCTQGDSAEELAADAARLAAAGYGVIYLKVGRGEAADLSNTAAVREAIGGRRLRLDANGAWSVVEALHMIRRLAVFEPEWIEQPTPADSIAALRQVHESAADAVVLSPHEAGGLLAFGRAAAVAAAAGVPICLHGQSVSSISDAAQHHLGLCTPNLTEGNQIMHQLLVEDLVSAPDLTPVRGKVWPFDAPGLGIELDRDAVARAADLYQEERRP